MGNLEVKCIDSILKNAIIYEHCTPLAILILSLLSCVHSPPKFLLRVGEKGLVKGPMTLVTYLSLWEFEFNIFTYCEVITYCICKGADG